MLQGAHKNDAFNSKQESQRISQPFLGCHTRGYVAGDVAANFPVSGFCGGLRQVEMGVGWWVHMNPAWRFGAKSTICFICPHPWSLPPKKSLLGKKKKKSPSLQETSLRQFFLLSCNLLSCLCRPSDPAGFSHPFSQQMPKSGRRVGAGRLRWGPNNHEKQLWWWLAGRPDPVYPSSSLIFSWLFD